mgnify:CR=1 FL=1
MTTDTTSDRKCYGQYCTVTTALDLAGDRWTLLILRELLGGPARFEELVDGLQGIARNLLSGRLRRLEADGLVQRVDGHGASLYRLTPLGAGSRTALEELGFWGAQLPRAGPAVHDRSVRAIAMAVQAILSRAGDALPTESHLIELDVDGELIEVVLGPEPTAIVRIPEAPRIRIGATRSVMSNVLVGQPFADADLDHLAGDASLLPVFTEAMRAPFRRLAAG